MNPLNMQTHLQPTVDELIVLFPGVRHTELDLYFRVLVAQLTLDYQGHAKVNNRVLAAGARA